MPPGRVETFTIRKLEINYTSHNVLFKVTCYILQMSEVKIEEKSQLVDE
jgi:hypothetical protein